MNNAKGVFFTVTRCNITIHYPKAGYSPKEQPVFLSQTIIPYFHILHRHLPFSCLAIIGYISVLLKKSIFWGDEIIVNTINFHDNLTETNALFRYFTLQLAWRHLGDTLETYRIYYYTDIMSVFSPAVVFSVIIYYVIINIR